MDNGLQRSKGTVLLTGIVMVVLGIVVLVNPIGALTTIVRIMGWLLVAFGVVSIVAAVMKGNPTQDGRGDLGLGIVALVPGLIMGIFPEFVMTFIWTIIGIIILITGLLDIFEAGAFRRVGSPLGLPATVSGIMCVALGVLVILVPMASPTLGMLVAAVALIINGLTDIIFGLGM